MIGDPHNYQPEEIDEAETAAAIAAVVAYLSGQEKVSVSGVKRVSQWKAYGRLKDIGHSPKGRLPDSSTNLWKALSYPLIVILSLVVATTSCRAAGSTAQKTTTGKPAIADASTTSVDPEESQPDAAAPKAPEAIPTFVKVGLSLGATTADISAPDGAEIRDAASGDLLANLAPDSQWKLSLRANGVNLAALTETSRLTKTGTTPEYMKVRFTPRAHQVNDDQHLTLALSCLQAQAPVQPQAGDRGYFIVPPEADSIIGLGGKHYRGALWIQSSHGNPAAVNVINIVELEDYLLSVLPSEMPSGWPVEALKAQSIAARSYAVASLGKHETDGYDIKATTEDQVYQGIASETAATNQAVADTAGIVIKHKGKVVPGFFHSTSGGYTELAEYVWGNPVPYLQSVPDYDDASPRFTWSQPLTVQKLEDTLVKSGVNIGDVLGMFVVSRSPTQRARCVLITGSDGVHIVSSDEFRRLFQLPSTNFNFSYDQESYVVSGRGFGHALGLSQWGARSLAEQGYNAAQILTYYYRDVALDYF